MGKRYGTWKRKFKDASGEEKELYYACSRRGNVTDFDGLAEIITEISSLSKGDILSSLTNIEQVMLWKLIDGDSVRFGDIGTFSIAVTSDGFENPEDITPDKVRATKIVFTPTKKFNKLLLEMKFTNYDKRLRKALGKRYSK
ncbi:hypothetical protein SDC9_18602 [bioreactor metagenome]|mgnify:FL=1|jgi:predicted histone-like DNA-binding protein|uniref:HU domain-containing protein n=1 Tax=bioreactor metagenome TaxID=1076179 RepID=A0A644U3Q8_9ZZZZ|nr:DNA-binding protein [Bacteroidales bacterium]MDD3667846.1 DNA-binding protein [Bacteroidales bacterium]MDD4068792.1 DNA-binding protein [Bacteroidales bacterium]MEA4967283.1 HU family DNA-binding protein [Bacteroidaceae bacterium]MEA5099780.1 HU family DNA-binding protein [Bacteroidales bacterium]